jgi:hypothetical protein
MGDKFFMWVEAKPRKNLVSFESLELSNFLVGDKS